MAWLSRNDFTSGEAMSHAYLNNLANDIRAWGGNVNGGGFTLSNVSAITATATVSVNSGVVVLGPNSTPLTVKQSVANNGILVTDGVPTTPFNLTIGLNSSGAFARGVIQAIHQGVAFVPLVLQEAGGTVGVGLAAPTAQFHVYGAGQATSALADSVPYNGALYVQDTGGAAGNGGAVLFGAVQGHWCAIKGLINDGSANTTGHLAFSVRAATAHTALTEAMRITYQGRVGIGKTAPGTILAVAGLPTHADNTAASGAGLTAGDFYRTSTGIVMVTF